MTASTVVLISIAIVWMCLMGAIFLCREWVWQERPRRLCRQCHSVCHPDKYDDGTMVCPICQALQPLQLESVEACSYFRSLRDDSLSPTGRYYDGSSRLEEATPPKMPAVLSNTKGASRQAREAKKSMSAIPYIEEGPKTLSG